MAKKKTRIVTPYIFPAILLIPVVMLFTWLLWPKKKMVVAIIDKTVLTTEGQEHASLTWILTNKKYSKTNSALYAVDRDYFGFFPKDSNRYELHGLENFSTSQIEKLSNDADMIFFTDAYGIYANEWYKNGNVSDRSGLIYGGLHKNDVELMRLMKAKKKLVIAEFNCLGSPTKPGIDSIFKGLFGVQWSGWIGRYFETLDTSVNKELPRWLINYYSRQYKKPWNFKKSGVALVNKSDKVVILENGTDLAEELPVITTTKHAQDYYNLPASFKYSFWFEILNIDSKKNNVLAEMTLMVNKAGRKQLDQAKIPVHFPAVIRHNADDYKFWYFAADFSDNPLNMTSAYFKGVHLANSFFYNHMDEADRSKFFWKFYRPLVSTILDDYYATLSH
jgi:hypothetical protein